MDQPSKCAVLVPALGAVEPETWECLQRLAERGYPVRLLKQCSQVDLARSCLASAALDDGFDETMWIDSDVVFDPADVEKLRGHGLPLTAGLYMRKKFGTEPACKFLAEGPVVFGEGGGLLEVRYVGMGFTHVRRAVYESVEKAAGLPRCGGGYDPTRRVVPYFIPSIAPDGAGGWCYLSEDYSFVHRAREAGFAAAADTTIRLGHGTGSYKFTWDDMLPRPAYASVRADVTLPK